MSDADPIPRSRPVQPTADGTRPAPESRRISMPPARVSVGERVRAAFEVIICSGFPTQVLLVVLLTGAGLEAYDADLRLQPGFVIILSLTDAALVVGLVLLFLVGRGESPGALLIGRRSPGREAALGALLLPPVFAGVALLLVGLRTLVPSLHNVPRNPLEDLLQRPADAWLFGVALVVAGGLREEIQRAFVLHRFEQYLGGAGVGLVVFSLAFGIGHIDQGRDIALITALLGGFWGLLYLGRRSIVAPAVCHAGFNLTEVVRYLLTR